MKNPTTAFYPPLLFVLAFGALCFAYQYHNILFKRPQSVHKWRQADGASFALNYYQGGMNPLDPQVHNLTSDQGTTGKCYPSEMPWLYYLVACLYKVFGYHEWLFRAMNTMLFFIGLFFLFRTVRLLVQDVFWAIAIPLLLFTSPLVVFYANNFTVNTSALALTLVAWYFLVRYLLQPERKWFRVALLFFFLAASLKVTALFSLAGCGAVYLWGLFRAERPRLFDKQSGFIIFVPAVVIILAAYLVFAGLYNKRHDCTYFSTSIFPLWSLQPGEVQYVLHNMRHIWLKDYFHVSVLVLLAAAFIYTLWARRRGIAAITVCTLVTAGLSAVYFVLQFRQFGDHDYYMVDVFILPALILLHALYMLRAQFPRLLHALPLKIAFGVLLLLNVYYAAGRSAARYDEPVNDFEANKDFYTVTPYLRQLGITPRDTVIAIPDFSHVSLYLMNQKGWTEYVDMRLNKGEPIRYNADSVSVQASISKGARYLVLNGIEALYRKPYLQSFATSLIGRYNRVLVFDLQANVKNFSLAQRKIRCRYFCDAEILTDDKQSYRGLPDSVHFAYGQTQTDSLAYSGKYACVLNRQNPYGMTIKLANVQRGESIKINAWRKTGGKAQGALIISADSTFYDNQYEEGEVSEDGWQKISKELFIPASLSGKELVIYLYCEGEGPILFDDFEVTWYEDIQKNLPF